MTRIMKKPSQERGLSPEGNAQPGSGANGAGRALTEFADRLMIASGYEKPSALGEQFVKPGGHDCIASAGGDEGCDKEHRRLVGVHL